MHNATDGLSVPLLFFGRQIHSRAVLSMRVWTRVTSRRDEEAGEQTRIEMSEADRKEDAPTKVDVRISGSPQRSEF